jgi:hypothetical protein
VIVSRCGSNSMEAHDSPPTFSGPARSPEWATLTRLAGDRAGILLQQLRRGIGRIAGLQEEIICPVAVNSWELRYCIGKEILFSLYVRPASLEAVFTIESSLRDTFFRSPLAKQVQVNDASLTGGPAFVRALLRTQKDVRFLTSIVIKNSKLLNRRVEPLQSPSAGGL